MKGQYWAILLLSVVMLSGCAGRALTVNESAFLGTVHKLGVDYKKVKIHKSLAGSEAKLDKMFGGEKSVMVNGQALGREEVDRIVAGMPEAFVLYNDIYYQKDSYSNDFIPEWPDYVRIDYAALLAHEVTHVWQHQHKDLTGYSPLKALLEHQRYDNPYAYKLEDGKRFLQYRYEQQGKMVQDFVWLELTHQRTDTYYKLKALIDEVFPIQSVFQFISSQRGE